MIKKRYEGSNSLALNLSSLIREPGDKLEVYMTKTQKKVLKYSNREGKYSATQYPNGTLHETRTIRNINF